MTPLEKYFDSLKEPTKSCLLAIKDLILIADQNIHLGWKWNIPFFTYQDRMFCYFNIHKQSKLPYIGFPDGLLIDHPALVLEGRKRMKAYYIQPDEDIDRETLDDILSSALAAAKKK